MAVWVNDNGTKREVHTIWVNDNGTKREVHTIWVNDNGTKREIPLLSFGSPSGTYISFGVGGTPANCRLDIDTDGFWRMYDDGLAGGTSLGSGRWISSDSQIDQYEVRTVETSGTFDTDPSNGSWLDVSVQRRWRVTRSGSTGIDIVTFTFEIRKASDLTTVLSETGINMEADYDSGA